MLLCDIDGVLGDWDGAAERLLGKPPQDLPKSQVWKAIEQEGFKFWADMEPLPWARNFIILLRQLDYVLVCSSPSLDPKSAAGKIKWMQKFFNDKSFKDFALTPVKHTYARPGVILIDDKEKHIDAFNQEGGTGILFPTRFNRNKRYSDDPAAYVVENLKSFYPLSRFPVDFDLDKETADFNVKDFYD